MVIENDLRSSPPAYRLSNRQAWAQQEVQHMFCKDIQRWRILFYSHGRSFSPSTCLKQLSVSVIRKKSVFSFLAGKKKMSSPAVEPEVPDLVCQIDNVQGMVDALSSVRWKRHQDAVIELSEHGIVLIVEESRCLQAKVYLKRELFLRYDYRGEGRPRFGVSLGLFIDCLNTFSVPGHSSVIEIRYPGPDMQLLLKSSDSPNACIYAELRTRIPETISWDYNFEPAGSTPLSFTVKSAALKEAIDDLEWPGASIQITLQPDPPCVTFRGEGHGDLQIDFMYLANTDLLIAFQCNRQTSFRYKYKFLRATTSNIPGSVIKDNRGSKLTMGRGGMLKVQHLVSVSRSVQHPHIDSAGYQQPSRIAYIEFFVKPEEDETPINDS